MARVISLITFKLKMTLINTVFMKVYVTKELCFQTTSDRDTPCFWHVGWLTFCSIKGKNIFKSLCGVSVYQVVLMPEQIKECFASVFKNYLFSLT